MKTNAERRAEIGVERRCKTLARILGAVIQVLEDKPFKDASIEDFVKSADVSRGTFYNYFENKAEVALSVATILNQMVEDSIASLEGNTDALERFATGQRLNHSPQTHLFPNHLEPWCCIGVRRSQQTSDVADISKDIHGTSLLQRSAPDQQT